MNEDYLFNQFPEIQSDEFILSKITAAELDDFYEICSNETLYKYSASSAKKNKAVVYNMITQFERDFNHKKAIYWGIYRNASPVRLLGILELFHFDKDVDMVTIGYMINESYWGQGIATKCVALALQYLFYTVNINRVQALVLTENERSKRVLTRNHFTHEGTLREGMYWKHLGVVSIDIYSILKREFTI